MSLLNRAGYMSVLCFICGKMAHPDNRVEVHLSDVDLPYTGVCNCCIKKLESNLPFYSNSLNKTYHPRGAGVNLEYYITYYEPPKVVFFPTSSDGPKTTETDNGTITTN